MGITAGYLSLPPDEFAHLEADQSAALQFFYGFDDPQAFIERQMEETAQGRRFTLEKDWHALHFLLTGSSSMDVGSAPPPFGNVVLGGKETAFEASYGHYRLLDPSEVRDVARALTGVSLSDLKERFDPDAFNANKIYPDPSPGGWDAEQIESLWLMYPDLVGFFERASESGHLVLVSLN